jgi:hypothetical protein
MVYDIRMISAKDFIRLDAEGRFDLPATQRMFRDTMWACVNSKIGRVLLDIRDASADMTVAQVVSLAAICGEITPTMKDHKIAILNRPKDELDRAQIVASVAAQHHWNIRAFRDFEQAFDWLIVEPDAGMAEPSRPSAAQSQGH